MGDTNRAERLQIIFTAEELTALDDWRFANRMPTRAAAIRELLKRGMGVRLDSDGNKIDRRSRDVRLVDRQAHAGNGRQPARGNGAHSH